MRLAAFVSASLLFLLAPLIAGASPAVGAPAPEFRLQDQTGDWHSLADFRGSWLVLYFYPKDDTPGCTTEACAFRDDIFKFRKRGVKIVGISLDDSASHAEFAAKYQLPFTLLADTSHDTAKAYNVLGRFGPVKVAKRQTFLIDPEGRVAMHYKKVDPEAHSEQMLNDLDRLQAVP